MDWQILRCSLTFEFMVLIHDNDSSCYLDLSLRGTFHGLIEPQIHNKTSYIIYKCIINKQNKAQIYHI